ncbi:MAG: threonine-phosphate decarboxylase CobD [Marinovum sp.]|nr:threonine-phosphate decarboxylase CobD [Marinovum sp.]
MRDHGGDLDRAQVHYGAGSWIDLSTGINAVPYPLPVLESTAWSRLPTRAETADLEQAAQFAYRTTADVLALAGAQAVIQLVPRLRPVGAARVVAPTYNEHAGALRAQGWQVTEVGDLGGLAGADIAIVVNPNNPDGRFWPADVLRRCANDVGLLVVDESFMDPTPEASLLTEVMPDNIMILRSFGKFYGLAGVRLGFAVGALHLIDELRCLAGPWAASGPAIAIGETALRDQKWQATTRARLAVDCERLDAMTQNAGWSMVGGSLLFRTYDTRDAAKVQDALAHAHIWTRIFPYSNGWVRLGLPGSDEDWERLEAAFNGL